MALRRQTQLGGKSTSLLPPFYLHERTRQRYDTAMDDAVYPKRPLKQRLVTLASFTAILACILCTPVLVMYYIYPNTTFPFKTNMYPSIQTQVFSTPTPAYLIDVPVLMYHYIRTVENPDQDKVGFRLSVTPEDFEAHMKYLWENRYRTISPNELINALTTKTPLPPKSVLLTFDDGYADFYTNAYPVLKKYNLQATLYVISGFVSDEKGRYITWDQLKELDESGIVTIGSHTVHHINVATNPKAQEEIIASKKMLERFLRHEVSSFVYPGGTWNQAAADFVTKAGYTHAFTTEPGTQMKESHKYNLPRVRISGGVPLGNFPQALKAMPASNE